MDDTTHRVAIRVTGRVQGVGFRAAAREEARAIGLRGWVRNDVDGAVRAAAEGTASQVEAFERWCRQGPARARVEDVRSSPLPGEGDLPEPFAIRR